MKITDITINESTTAGAIATVAAPMSTQKRSDVGKGVYGNEKPGNLLTGKKTSKKYANSISESPTFKDKKQCIDYFVKRGKSAAQGAAAWERGYRGPTKKSEPMIGGMSDMALNMQELNDKEFLEKYGKTKDQIRTTIGDPNKTTVHEEQLGEDDLILVPGQGHRLKTGFHAFDPDKAEHEGETLKNSLRTIARNAKEPHRRLEDHDQFPEWVSEKIGQIKGMMTGVTEYLISSQEPAESAGVIAGGGVGEAADPIAKRITVKKWGGDDKYSWAVLVDGRPAVTGLGKNEVPYYKNMIMKKLQEKPSLTGTQIEEGIVDKIKGAVRREKAKDMPLVQTRRDYAMGKGGEAYNKGETRKGNQYMAYAEKDRKKKNDPTTNPAGTYRTKTSDYTNEAQSMKGALKNTLAKAEPGSKLDNSIKSHNRDVKNGGKGTLKNAPTGYHFDKKGYCRLGDK